MLTIDFETEAIEGNPIVNPPRPVGVSIKKDGQPSLYYSWGHPSGNNTNFENAREALLNSLDAAEASDGWLSHNAAFECAVLREYFLWEPSDPLKVHDTKYQLFLTEPYAYSYSLKPSAERVLGLPPDEQDELRDWILRNVPGATAKNFGAYICKAPGELVGKYAEGDTDRTYLLNQKLMPEIIERGMLEAYQREQKLAPVLWASTRRGVRLDVSRLAADLPVYDAAYKIALQYIHSVLGEFELSKDAQLAAALERADMVTEWVLTPTGKKSVSRKNLQGNIKDPLLMQYIGYCGILDTCLGTFARPWLRLAEADGRLHAEWNQVRGERGSAGDVDGTRTGRMSCKNPNLTNIPNDFEGVVIPDEIKAFIDAQAKLLGHEISYVPYMRRYMLPEEGHVWIKRDFSAQEMRIMAHFAEGSLFEAFKADPSTDPHVAVQKIIKENAGIELSRKFVKITGFGIMYGRGVKNLALALGVDEGTGKQTRDAYYAALPEVRQLSYATRDRGKRGQAIKTWGGRLYYREPNPDRDLSYKLLNYLIQGSAADQTKQSLVDWADEKGPDVHLTAAVHDEINASAPADSYVADMACLQKNMDADRFDTPFQSEGYLGPNWADILKEKR